MTIVIGERFADRVCILADTSISSDHAPGPDDLPGRLKAFVLNPQVSVAFAGAADRAFAALQTAQKALHSSGIEGLYAVLESNSDRDDPSWDNSVDYLVASHLPNAELHTVKRGARSAPLVRAWLGSSDAYQAFLRNEARPATQNEPRQPVGTEPRFIADFVDLFAGGTSVSPGVGGAYFNLLGSPRGHCYQDLMGSSVWMPITLGIGRTARHEESRLTGEGEFVIGSMSTRYRGVAVTAVYVPQARHAYIYGGLLDSKPVKYRLLSDEIDWRQNEATMQTALLNELDRIAELIGGGILVD